MLSSYIRYVKELEDGEKADNRWEMGLLLLQPFLQGQCHDGGLEEKGI